LHGLEEVLKCLTEGCTFSPLTYGNQNIVIKPWGKYETVYFDEFKVKIITVNPGQRLSLQRHRWRSEHWFIAKGVATVENDSYIIRLYEHASIDVGRGVWHRVTNKEIYPLILVEVQMGNCFEEDIERAEDDYGR